MKHMFKYLAVAILLVTSLTLKAADASTNLVGSGLFSLRNNAIHLTSLEIVNNHPSSAATVNFFDSSTTNLTYVVGAYTNTLTYLTNIVVITTDYYSNKTTNTNAAVWTAANAVAQSTNNFRQIKTLSAAAGATSGWLPAGGEYLSFGLLAQANVTNVTVNYIYSDLR